MLRQYRAQRRAGGFNPFGAGTIRIGTIIYIQDRLQRFQSPIRRNPWIVIAWRNRECFRGLYATGGHLAIVQSLRDGRMQDVADHLLLWSEELDCVKVDATYENPPTYGRVEVKAQPKPSRRSKRAA